MTDARNVYNAGPRAGVAPFNGAYQGGTYRAASKPLDVGGGFSQGLNSFRPVDVHTPVVTYTRSDRGSNVKIPYSRVSALIGSIKMPVVINHTDDHGADARMAR